MKFMERLRNTFNTGKTPNKQELALTNTQISILFLGTRCSRAQDIATQLDEWAKSKNIMNLDVSWIRNSEHIFQIFDDSKKIPTAIVLFPEMRLGQTLSVDVNTSGIAENVADLCQQHNVKFLQISPSDMESDTLLSPQMKALITSKTIED
jgi:hypothetical protein